MRAQVATLTVLALGAVGMGACGSSASGTSSATGAPPADLQTVPVSAPSQATSSTSEATSEAPAPLPPSLLSDAALTYPVQNLPVYGFAESGNTLVVILAGAATTSDANAFRKACPALFGVNSGILRISFQYQGNGGPGSLGGKVLTACDR